MDWEVKREWGMEWCGKSLEGAYFEFPYSGGACRKAIQPRALPERAGSPNDKLVPILLLGNTTAGSYSSHMNLWCEVSLQKWSVPGRTYLSYCSRSPQEQQVPEVLTSPFSRRSRAGFALGGGYRCGWMKPWGTELKAAAAAGCVALTVRNGTQETALVLTVCCEHRAASHHADI